MPSCPLPAHHSRKPSRMPESHPLHTRRKTRSIAFFWLPRAPNQPGHPEPQSHKIPSSWAVGAGAPRAEGPGNPSQPPLPLPSLLGRVCGSGGGRLWLCALLDRFSGSSWPWVVGMWSLWGNPEFTLEGQVQVEVLGQKPLLVFRQRQSSPTMLCGQKALWHLGCPVSLSPIL